MSIIYIIISWLIVGAISILGLFLGRKYVYDKVRINKFIPLAIGVILFILQGAIIKNSIASLVTVPVIIFFIFWFFDVMQTGGPKKKEKQIKIKPKAKPNRVKNSKK